MTLCFRRTVERTLIKPLISVFIWAFLSSIIPTYVRSSLPIAPDQDVDGYLNSTSLYQLNSENVVTHGLINTDVVIVTAHPDDESMFFTPTILELAKADYGNVLHLLCFSNGNYDGLGEIRAKEIHTAARYLGISSVKLLDYEDNITKMWETSDIVKTLETELQVMEFTKPNVAILSFDEGGVSNHPNHRSLFNGVSKFTEGTAVRFFKLTSWPLLEKYSFFVWTNMQLLWRVLQNLGPFQRLASQITGSPLKYPATSASAAFTIFSDFNGWFVSLSTMTYAHYSQIVWYRWLWIVFSRYMNSNELVPVAN